MANLNGFAHDELAFAVINRAGFAFIHAADVGAQGPGEVAARRDVAQVVVELVGACHKVLAAL